MTEMFPMRGQMPSRVKPPPTPLQRQELENQYAIIFRNIATGLNVVLLIAAIYLLMFQEQGKSIVELAGDDISKRILLVSGAWLLFAVLAAEAVPEVFLHDRSLLAMSAVVAAAVPLFLNLYIGFELPTSVALILCALLNYILLPHFSRGLQRHPGIAFIATVIFLVVAGLWPGTFGGALGSGLTLMAVLISYAINIYGLSALGASLAADSSNPAPTLAHTLAASGVVLFLLLLFAFVSFMFANISPLFGRVYLDLIRTIDGTAIPPAPSLSDAYNTWLERNSSPIAPNQPTKPLVLVAAAGGGIRASYWTSLLLSQIAGETPTFQDQLFAASGVSGGSLGLSVFYAAIAEGPRDCGVGGRSCVVRFHSGDFLAGPLMATLVGSPLNAIIPLSPMASRSVALETSWELQWRITLGQPLAKPNPFADRITALRWPNRNAPLLILNTTSVSNGDRLLSANVQTAGWFNSTGSCQVNLAERLNLPLSAAAGASARFPGITDWGWFDASGVDGCNKYEGVADGGVYDNYGAATMLDLLNALPAVQASNKTSRTPIVKPITIQITSDPDNGSTCVLSQLDKDTVPDFAECSKKYRADNAHPPYGWESYRLFFKTDDEAKAFVSGYYDNLAYNPISPGYPGVISVFSRGRMASGIRVARLLRTTTTSLKGCYYHFSMSGLERIPLGWTLSVGARQRIEANLNSEHNQRALRALVSELKSPSEKCGYG